MIPAELLVHSCKYSTSTTTDRDGNAVYTTVELQYVRLGPVVRGYGLSTAGETAEDKLTLYIVPGKTTPAVIPVEKALIEWQGKTYTIRSVTPCYTSGTDAVHHYEAALV